MKSGRLVLITAVLATVTMVFPLGAAWAGPVNPSGIFLGPDINGDKKSDVVIEDTNSGAPGFIIGYQLDGTSLTGSPSAGAIAGSYGDFVTVDYADVNGDDVSDKIMELRDGGPGNGFTVAILLQPDFAMPTVTEVPASYGTSATVAFVDVNGDGVADKIVESNTTGDRQTAAIVFDGTDDLMTSTTVHEFVPQYDGFEFATDSSGNLVGLPDINGDFQADAVIDNAGSGLSIAYLTGDITDASFSNQFPTVAEIPGTYGTFTLLGFADVNGDGNADKIIEDDAGFIVAFLLDDSLGSTTVTVPGTYTAGHETFGFPDLNGDGQADKVQWDPSTGEVIGFILGDLDGADLTYTAGPLTAIGATDTLLGFPDLDGDLRADQVWSTAGGEIMAALTDGLTQMGAATIVTLPSADFSPSGFESQLEGRRR